MAQSPRGGFKKSPSLKDSETAENVQGAKFRHSMQLHGSCHKKARGGGHFRGQCGNAFEYIGVAIRVCAIDSDSDVFLSHRGSSLEQPLRPLRFYTLLVTSALLVVTKSY